uniref:Nonsense-mediated mRNA decay factor SMG9 n=1 Tax=Sinocyclocheilus grahami TaxID=75366 RepID=A0A672QTU7_SINGR
MSESGHSQPGMYGQGRRRRRRRDRDPGPPAQNLSGPSRDRDYVPRERRVRFGSKPSVPASGAPSLEKPIMLIKTRDEGGKPGNPSDVAPSVSGAGTAKLEREGQRPTQPVYQIQNRGMGSAASGGAVDPVIGQTKLLPPEKMKHSIKLVDDQMNWCDSAMEYLRDQTDMLVVGVIGLQGTGKSTIMSLLSANSPEEDQRAYVFRAQTQEIKERAGNQSSGIDFYITQERVIFLDTQPILSPSILDHLINNDRKLPPEYNLPHTYVEMQSLQITAFLFTVCHVVIVIQDWFTDINLYSRFLQTAEMLKPSTPSASHDSTGSSGADDGSEYYPHIVFLQNKARREEFCPRNLKKMHMAVDKLMAHSHLKYKGTLSMLDCNIFPGLNRDYLETEVNLFLLPMMENDGEDALTRAGSGPPLFSLLPGYRGHPSFSSLVSKFRSQILAMSRSQLSHTILTEKNWFHYAARIWDGVKKSSALSEYSRLLS